MTARSASWAIRPAPAATISFRLAIVGPHLGRRRHHAELRMARSAPPRGISPQDTRSTSSPGAWTTRPRLVPPLPGTISTGALVKRWTMTNYPANEWANCTNCFAIPKGTGANFNAGASLANRAAHPSDNGTSFIALNWATRNVPATAAPSTARATNSTPTRSPITAQAFQFTGGAVTVDQRLTKDISFYGEGFYGMRRARVSNKRNEPARLPVPTLIPLSDECGSSHQRSHQAFDPALALLAPARRTICASTTIFRRIALHPEWR